MIRRVNNMHARIVSNIDQWSKMTHIEAYFGYVFICEILAIYVSFNHVTW